MDRRKERDQPLAVERRMDREIDRHHADGEDVDRHVDDLEHGASEAAEHAAHLIIGGDQRAVLSLACPRIAQAGQPVGEAVDAPIPTR